MSHLTPEECQPKLRLKLDIPRGNDVELVLFKALLAYAEGRLVIVWAGVGAQPDGRWMLHGRKTCQHIAESGVEMATTMFRIECDDSEEVERIGKAFNAKDCDWPEMLAAARTNFIEHGASRNQGYVAWIRHEIARRERVN